MKLIHRFAYYLGGASIGIIFLVFFLNGSGTKIPSFDYLPNARVLKTIRTNGYSLSDNAEKQLNALSIDTTIINNVLKTGDVDFSESDARKKPCGKFVIKSSDDQTENIILTIENCDKVFTINNISSF